MHTYTVLLYYINEPSEGRIDGSPERVYAHTRTIITNRFPGGNAKIASVVLPLIMRFTVQGMLSAKCPVTFS